MTDPTNKARQAAYRARRAKEGLKEVRGIWADEQWHAGIKKLADMYVKQEKKDKA